MPTKRECRQVVIRLIPGGEPWFRVEVSGGPVFSVPANTAIIQVWEKMTRGRALTPAGDGEVMVLVPLGDVLTIGGYRERARRRASQAD